MVVLMDESANEVSSVAHYCTFWDSDYSPPWDEIQARVNTLIRRGATSVHIVEPNCGRDDYCLVVADRPIGDEEAETLWDDWFRRLPDDDAYTWYEEDEPEPD